MGPFLKFLLGLFLTVWIIIGVGFVAGGTVLAIQLPNMVSKLQSSIDSFAAAQQGGENKDQDSQMQAMECAQKDIKTARMEQIQKGSQPTSREKQILDNCGYRL